MGLKTVLFGIIAPINGVSYFRSYMSVLARIRNPPKDSKTIFLVKFLILCNLLKTGHMIYLSFVAFCPNCPGLPNPTIQFDLFQVLVGKPKINIILALSALLAAYYDYWLAFKPNLGLLKQLEQVLINQKVDFFLTHKDGAKNCQQVKRVFLAVLNVFLIGVLDTGLYTIIISLLRM